MINSITKYNKSKNIKYDFSILLPSWNNLEYLKLCVKSIQKNSSCNNQIIVILNEATDGSLEWIEQQKDIDYIHAKENIGVCYALNITRSLIKSDYIIYINDDMYVLPNWDKILQEEIYKIGTKNFMISSTMIEPIDTGNPCVIVKNYGTSITNFNEKQLLNDSNKIKRADWSGSTWPPNAMHIDVWDLVGGMSIEYSPGMGSDPDLSRKFFEVGVRHFIGLGNSLVYHFGSKSTKRVTKNDGRKTFLKKWGVTQRFFSEKQLNRGNIFDSNLIKPYSPTPLNSFITKIKSLF